MFWLCKFILIIQLKNFKLIKFKLISILVYLLLVGLLILLLWLIKKPVSQVMEPSGTDNFSDELNFLYDSYFNRVFLMLNNLVITNEFKTTNIDLVGLIDDFYMFYDKLKFDSLPSDKELLMQHQRQVKNVFDFLFKFEKFFTRLSGFINDTDYNLYLSQLFNDITDALEIETIFNRYNKEDTKQNNCKKTFYQSVKPEYQKFFYPFIFGKIYYSTKTEIHKKIMDSIKQRFSVFSDIKRLIHLWNTNLSDKFLKQLNYLNQPFNDFINLFKSCTQWYVNPPRCARLLYFLTDKTMKDFVVRVTDALKRLESAMDCAELNKFSERLQDVSYMDDGQILAEIIFNESPTNKILDYTIKIPRSRTDGSESSNRIVDPTYFNLNNDMRSFQNNIYLANGFLTLQEAIDYAFMEQILGVKVNFSSQYFFVKGPCVDFNYIPINVRFKVSIFISLAWITSFYILILFIVYEKEQGLFEYMKIMGLTCTLNWVNWLILSLEFLLLISVYIIVLIFAFSFLEFSGGCLLLLIFIFISFSISLTCQIFFVSTLFSKSFNAAIYSGLLYILLIFPYLSMNSYGGHVNAAMVYIYGLITQTNIIKVLELLFWLEGDMLPLTFDNLFIGTPWFNPNIQIFPLIMMFYVSSVLYLALAFYIEKVFPGEYSSKEKWNFLFTKAFWCANKNGNLSELPNNDNITDKILSKNFEAESPDWIVSVKIINLVKYYSSSKTIAVNKLNLNFYKSQITSFLGKNGAGKSTTFAILTGYIQPNDGTFIINELDGLTHMSEIRQIIGFCPQQNILWDNLTVMDHIMIFSYLKGISMSTDSVNEMLRKCEIEDKKSEKVINLSGGMKRKLSLSLAFLGKPQVIFLDEPTAGVDPESRNNIWQFILQEKSPDRAIILSTHLLDEADYLSDRVVIIAEGQLECSGTAMFLKNIYGDGYYLSMTKSMLISDKYYPGQGKLDHTIKVIEFFKEIVPDSFLSEETKTSWTFVIPKTFTEMADLLEKIDEKREILLIDAYGISDATLEQVFIKSTEKKVENADPDDEIPIVYECIAGYKMYLQQLIAVLYKRISLLKHNLYSLVYEIVIPLILSIILIVLFSVEINFFWFINSDKIINPWAMSLDKDKSIKTLFCPQQFANVFGDLFFTIDGVGAPRCITSGLLNLPCENRQRIDIAAKFKINDVFKNNFTCDCKRPLRNVCKNKGFNGIKANNIILQNSDVLVNFTNYTANESYLYYFFNYPKIYYENYGNFIIDRESTYGDAILKISNGKLFANLDHFANFKLTNFTDLAKSLFLKDSNCNDNIITIQFNNKGYWSLPGYVNIKNNWLLNKLLILKGAHKEISNYGIYVRESMLNTKRALSSTDIGDMMVTLYANSMTIIIITITINWIISSFIMQIIEDRVSGSKFLQMLSGLNVAIYWAGNFIFDFAKLIVVSIVIILLLLILQSFLISSEYFPIFFVLYLFNGISKILMTYALSYMFSTPSTAYIVLFVIDILAPIILNFIYLLVSVLAGTFTTNRGIQVLNGILHLFYLLPQFSFLNGLLKLMPFIKENVMSNSRNYFSISYDGINILFLILFGILSFCFLVINDMNLISLLFINVIKKLQSSHLEVIEDDEDVKFEKSRISDIEVSNNLAMKSWEVSKVYGLIKKFNAINSLSFGVNQGECFGLLGKNGAGKTTFFKILTEEIFATDGEILVNNVSLSTNTNSMKDKIGFCPQFNYINEYLTVCETLKFYFLIRGVKNQERMETLVLDKMQLNDHKSKLVSQLSGGNKRKLSAAISMIGNGPLLLMDEPTAGMDAESRIFLWNRIRQLQNQTTKNGQPRSVVITSHNMAEIEVLCNRVLIMSNGKILAIGTIQHLKERFSNDYHVRIGLGYELTKEESRVIIERQLKSILQDPENGYESIKDDNEHYLHYIINEKLPLSEIFKLFELMKQQKYLAEYSIQQNNLNDLFIKLVNPKSEKAKTI